MSRSAFFCLAFLVAIQSFGQKRVESYKPIVRHSSDGLHITNTNDGGLLVYGFVDYIDGQPSGLLSKVHADGTLWPGFTRVTGPGWITKARITPSGKILVMGNFTINGIRSFALLNPDGTLDPTFHVPFDVYDFVIQSDGRIIVELQTGLQRLLSDGSPDPSYTGESLYFQVLALDSDDNLYASSGGILRRYNVTGARDNTFPDVITSNSIRALGFYSDGDIFIGGDFETVNGTPKSRLARISSTGILDPDFDANVTLGQIGSICFRDDHIIFAGPGLVVDGTSTSAAEVLPTGELHQSIALTFPSTLLDVTLIDDKLTIAGGFTTVNGLPRVGLAQVNTDNTVSEDFNYDVAYGLGWTLLPSPVVDSENRLIVFGGGHPNYRFLGLYEDGTPINRQIVRINTNGRYEPGWDIDESFIVDITATAIQPDDKIIMGGHFVVNGTTTKLVRLMPDGAIDPDFNVSMDPGYATISKITVGGNAIYISGQFNSINGTSTNSLAVIDFDGNLTQAFPNLVQEANIRMFHVQEDGKILFVSSELARLNPDGTPDGSFTPGPYGTPVGIVTDTQDRIYVCGSFNGLVRLLPNGQIDNSFSTGSGFLFKELLLSMSLLPNGNLMIGTYANAYQGQEANGAVVIRPDGSIETSADFGFEFGSAANALVKSEGGVYAVGRFVIDNFNDVFGVAKLNFPPPKPSDLAASVSIDGLTSLSWTDESDNEVGFEIERKKDGGSPEYYGTNPDVTIHQEYILPFATYSYRIRAVGDEGIYSDFDGPVSVYWDPTPEPPDQLAGSVDLKTVSLTWVDNSSNETGFVIQRKLMPNGGFVTIHTATADTENFVDLTAEYSQTYVYQLASVNTYAQSAFSSSITLTTEDDPIPAAPNALTGAVEGKLVQLSWNDNSDNETGFVIQRKVMPNGALLSIDTVAADVHDYVDLTASFSKTYGYRVAALNSYGLSQFSDFVSVSTLTIPAAPMNLSVELVGGDAKLSWEDVSTNEAGFLVERRIGVSAFGLLDSVRAAGTELFLDESDDIDASYSYRVAAYNLAGASPYSNIADVPVIAGLDADPTVSFSPNPVTSTLRIQFSSSNRNEIRLFDAAGREVLEVVKEQGSQVLTLSLEHLPPGIYVVNTVEPAASFRVIKH